MKMKQIKEMTNEELDRQIEEFRKEKFNLRAQSKRGQLESTAKVKQTRRDLARALTEKNARAAKA
ncbi:MAG: 50S ribosomal protein L29 [Lentisphaeria bacterium]|jgi:large subunit ribosomal protein L29|nr:50S ribosomal protein L29 [Lentisphaeria bacterium]